MGINLGHLESTTAPLNATSTTTPSHGLSLNLQKNDFLDLTKRNPGLAKVNLGAGWDVAQTGASFDLDIVAFLCHEDGKIHANEDVVFFNHKEVPGVRLNGDNLTGVGEGDDEVISLDLPQISPSISKVVFAIAIFNADAKRQTFGMVNNSYVRLLDVASGEKELCIYPLKEKFSTETAVVVAELVRDGNDWQFHAIGEGKHADINGLAALYM